MYSLFLIQRLKMIKKVSDKQVLLNKQYKIVSEQIRNDFDYCQCCFKKDNRNGLFCHEIAHIIGRRVKKYFADRNNLLLLCVECHRNLDAYKSHLIYNKNKDLFDYIINWLNYSNHVRKSDKLIDNLNHYLANSYGNHDPRIFENGIPIYKRSESNNNDYWGNIVGQYVYWYSHKVALSSYEKKQVSVSIHEDLKEHVLVYFNVTSTTQLTNENWAEFIAECLNYFAYELCIDVFEYGEKPKL